VMSIETSSDTPALRRFPAAVRLMSRPALPPQAFVRKIRARVALC